MADTLPNLPVSPRSKIDVELSLNVVNFGRGYSQRSSEHRQDVRRTYTVIHELLDTTDAATLRTFYEGNSDGQYILAPDLITDHTGATVRKWFVAKWSESYSSPLTHDFSATLIEVFDPS